VSPLKIFSRKWILTTILVVIGAAVCARLGIWQLDRLKQRRAFNAHVYAMQALPALELPTDAAIQDMEYRTVHASGTYDFQNEIALRNQSYQDQYGYHLVTPLKLSNGDAVLVDRGWIPADGNSTPAEWQQYDSAAAATVDGIIRSSQETAGFGGVSDPTPAPGQQRLDFWIYVNIPRIAGQLPYRILPVYIQQNPDATRTQPPIPYQEELDLSEGPHQGYAIQWFSFAGLLLLGYPFYVRRQENPKP
jgi:surfeit locus 1 family protein